MEEVLAPVVLHGCSGKKHWKIGSFRGSTNQTELQYQQ
jgi:hypothetical protein